MKLKQWQKRHAEKNYMAYYYCATQPYMRKKKEAFLNAYKVKKTFQIAAFRDNVINLIIQGDNGIGFPYKRGERCWSMTGNVSFSWGNMTFTPSGNNVKFVKRHD